MIDESRDIIEALEEVCSETELIDFLLWLYKETKHPNFKRWFYKKNLCYKCGRELQLTSYKEIHNELDEKPTEIFYESFCPECDGFNKSDIDA